MIKKLEDKYVIVALRRKDEYRKSEYIYDSIIPGLFTLPEIKDKFEEFKSSKDNIYDYRAAYIGKF